MPSLGIPGASTAYPAAEYSADGAKRLDGELARVEELSELEVLVLLALLGGAQSTDDVAFNVSTCGEDDHAFLSTFPDVLLARRSGNCFTTAWYSTASTA